MNSVSWFLYFVDVIGNFREASIAIMIILGFLIVFGGIMSPVAMDMVDVSPHVVWRVVKVAVVVWGFALLVSLVTPTKNTMYAIAASEVGEQMIKSEAVQGITSDAQKALQQWIKRQIEPEAKK